MKKIIFAAVLLLYSSLGFSQFNLGVKIGYNSSLSLANIASVTNGGYGIGNVSAEIWNNFQAGAFARIYFDKVYVQPELLYSMQKNNYQVTIKDASSNASSVFNKMVSVNTVNIPILVGYELIDLKVVNLRAFAGPMLQLDAGSTLNYTPVSGTGTVTAQSLMTDAKKANVGLQIGAGIDILKLTVDLRYNLISNVYEPKTNDYTLPSSTFIVSLGWKFL